LLRVNINLLDKRTKARAETTSKDNDFVFLRTEACAVAQRELELDIEQLPRTILDEIALNCIESLSTIIATEGVDVLLVDDGGGEGALADVHGCEVLPLVILDVVHLAAVEKDILDPVIPSHDVDERTINDSSVLLAHLVHAAAQNDLALAVDVLVHRCRAASASDQSVAIG